MFIPFLQAGISASDISEIILAVGILISTATWVIYYRKRFPSQVQELQKKFDAHVIAENTRFENMQKQIYEQNAVLTELRTDVKWIKGALGGKD